jgi:3-deoxy-manno-octulosonate cytidylyltransferase (CMP-KDO synthetase)
MEFIKVSKKSVLILIPARFASTRFPGKPLVKIGTKSMIRLVLENCLQTSHSDINFEAFVVTDDQRIEDHVKLFSENVIRVDDDVNSGSLRIQLAYERFFQTKNFDLIINVQGDEPLLSPTDLSSLADFHLKSIFDITTLVRKMPNFDELFLDANKVKAVVSEFDRRALYFSRAPIPYKRNQDQVSSETDYWYLHIGVYSYTPKALMKFSKGHETRLEYLEKLEQLRALEMGLSIGAIETQSLLIGVDNPDDVKKVEEVLNGRK